MKTTLALIGGLLISTVAFAARQKPKDLPECKDIVSQCEAPEYGFVLGGKDDGNGVWANCIAKRARGEEVKSKDGKSQIAATKDQAAACIKASKQLRGK